MALNALSSTCPAAGANFHPRQGCPKPAAAATFPPPVTRRAPTTAPAEGPPARPPMTHPLLPSPRRHSPGGLLQPLSPGAPRAAVQEAPAPAGIPGQKVPRSPPPQNIPARQPKARPTRHDDVLPRRLPKRRTQAATKRGRREGESAPGKSRLCRSSRWQLRVALEGTRSAGPS